MDRGEHIKRIQKEKVEEVKRKERIWSKLEE